MTPSRQTKLAQLVIAAAKTHKKMGGDPAPHDLPLAIAERIVSHLDLAWGLPEHEIERRIQNVSVGIVK